MTAAEPDPIPPNVLARLPRFSATECDMFGSIRTPRPVDHRWPPGTILEHARLDLLERLDLDDVRWLVA